MTLSLGDYLAIAGLLSAIVGVPMGLVVVNLRGLARRVDLTDDRMARVEERLERKTDKVEWARELLESRRKLDGMKEFLCKVDGKLDANFGIAAAIQNLSSAITRQQGTTHGN